MQIRVSWIGDSITSFENCSNVAVDLPTEVEVQTCYYPHGDVLEATQTWWARACSVIHGVYGTNDAIGGTCIGYYLDENGTEYIDSSHLVGSQWCMNNQNRVNDLGDADTSSQYHPDVIMLFGGTNDLAADIPCFSTNQFINNYSNILTRIYERYSDNVMVICITPFRCILTEHGDNFRQYVMTSTL